MSGHCRACADRLGERNPFALEMLNLSAWPDWLEGICLGCLYEMQLEESEGPLTIRHLNAYLAETFSILAYRAAKNLSLEHCEVINNYHFNGDPIMNCRRFEAYKIAGRRVCGVHYGLNKRGIALQFVEEDRRYSRPYVIWARGGNELVAKATRLAAELP
jgi:hypothetical protein